MKKILGIAALEQTEWPPFGKQRFFFEDMVNSSMDLELDFFFFSPVHNILELHSIDGWTFIDKTWIKVTKPIPHLIYDRTFSGNENEKIEINNFRNKLKENNFKVLNPVELGFLLDDKTAFHDFLKQANIPTLEYIKDFNLLFSDLALHQEYYLKPKKGSGGLGIYVLKKQENGIILKNHLNELVANFEDSNNFSTIIANQFDLNSYFIQPKAQIVPLDQKPYDIRVLVQNDGDDNYNITGMGVRTGQQFSNVSNLMAGGTALDIDKLEPHLVQHFNLSLFEFKKQLQIISIDCCKKLQDQFGSFAEIGLDFLMTKDKGLVIMEANTRPSRWIFNVMADNYPDKKNYYKSIRMKSVRFPAEYAIKKGLI
jgi:hypothetical protein